MQVLPDNSLPQIKRKSRTGEYMRWRWAVSDAYRAAGDVDKADRWDTCADPALFATIKIHQEALPNNAVGTVCCSEHPEHFNKVICPSCDDRCCPDCAHRQSARLLDRYMPVMQKFIEKPRRGWRFRKITLTTSISVRHPQVKTRIQDLYGAVRQTLDELLKERSKPAKMAECGVVVAHEFGPRGNRLHFHILFYGPLIPQAKLSDKWHALGGWPVVWIESVGNSKRHKLTLEDAVAEVVKYTTKFWKRDRFGKVKYVDPKLIPIISRAIEGTRRVRSWGLFYNAAEEKGKAYCPTCNAPLMLLSVTEFVIFRETGWLPDEARIMLDADLSDLHLKLADKSIDRGPPKEHKQELLL